MNRFVKNIIIFLLPILCILLVFEIFLRNLDTLYKRKLDGLLLNAESIELLILGNSHACYGVNPHAFDLYAYNMAQPNQSLYFDKRVTLKYIDKLINLKYVLISVDFHSLYFSSQGARDEWSYYGYGIEYKKKISRLSKGSYFLGYTPTVSWAFLRKKIYGIIDEKHSPVDVEDRAEGFESDKGWLYFARTDSTSMNIRSYQFRARIFNKTVLNSDERMENLSDLKDFIRILKQKGVTPILITAPCYSEFTVLLNPRYITQNFKDINGLRTEFSISYWDFTNEPFSKEDFFNCDHLNRKGSDKFSKELNLRLLKENR